MICTAATVPANPASTTAFLLAVPLKITVAPAPGTASALQLAASDQLFVAPRPVQVSDAETITVMPEEPLTVPLATVTVAEPVPEAGVVYRPLLLIEPRPLTDQVTLGCVLSAVPNWS